MQDHESIFGNSARITEAKRIALLILLCSNINYASLVSSSGKKIQIMLEDYELTLCESVVKVIVEDDDTIIYVNYDF